MSQYDDDITVVLFQPEANKPLECSLPRKFYPIFLLKS
ncbi:hypothetical protein JCM19233_4170 [Vibrio astriarenae]|nr:hypothetical protein JCM19233_4170 [Vibrio sp. C7]